MARKKKGRRRFVKPDDYFAAGPLEIARFGKNTVMRSRATAEQVAAAQTKMATRFPTVVAEIDALVSSIAAQIARLPPDRLLHRAWWEFATAVVGIGDRKDEMDQLAAARMVDYVQSVVASVKPAKEADEVSEEDWIRLKADVRTLFERLTLEYQSCATAHRRSQDPQLDMELEGFRVRAEMLWLNIRGKRYHVHERQALIDVLSPHSDVLLRLFGIDATTLVGEFDKVLTKLTGGLVEVASDMAAFRDKTIDQVEKLADQHPELDVEELHAKAFEDGELALLGEKVAGGLLGLDLFDVAKNTAIPQPLLDQLTWSPGEDAEFFSPGDFRGWPLRIWPTMKRPFIRIDGRVLCFDFFSLFDNIYRVLRRIVIQHDPSYTEIWNDRQKLVSEELPFAYLGRLLPGATIYRPVYYRWKAGSGPAQWHEADGILIFDDHLIIIEVKGGAFTYTSPANDLPAHLASLRNLLQSPARQGSRFVDYLESAPEVPIADSNHNEIARLRHSDFRQVTVCTVTLDAFTDLAARAQHLASLGISIGQRPVWPLSIDDLRVYAELFDNPLVFLHFIEQRVRAGQSKYVDLNDEMDHLGLYIEQNNYSQFAAQMMENQFDRLGFGGFRTPIDEFFSARLRGEQTTLPKQSMPPKLAEIISFLAQTNRPHRSELASFLLDGSGAFRDTFVAAIEQALRDNRELKRARPLSIYGAMAMTLYVWSPSAPALGQPAEDHVRAVMVARDEASRRLVELTYNDDGVLIDAQMKHVTLAGLANAELDRIKAASLSLQSERLGRARAQGKIGRNDACPCGSGKKYKRCHGRSA
ncbi:preprotein translocase subunit SecA [Bradyrhizobium sp. USDA 10063]